MKNDMPWIEKPNKYQYWLNIGSTKTSYPNYNSLWCLNYDLDVISVMIPRDIIQAVLEAGIQLFATYEKASDIEVGIAFIQHIEDDIEDSMFIPQIIHSHKLIEFMDSLAFKTLNGQVFLNAVSEIKRYTYLREFWQQSVAEVKAFDYDSANLPVHKHPINRATSWGQKSLHQGNYFTDGNVPVYWYTYKAEELHLGFLHKYKMLGYSILRKFVR